MVKTLNVLMNGQKVGVLEKTSPTSMTFSYCMEWLEREDAVPISCSLPLGEKPFSGDKVFSFFGNLLPDSVWDLRQIQKLFSFRSLNPFDTLAAIGKDCIGALQFVRPDEDLTSPKISGEEVGERGIASILRNILFHPLGLDPKKDFRIVISGAQEKTAFLKVGKSWLIPHAGTPTTHIFKLPMGNLELNGIDLTQSCEIEWLSMALLRNAGLDVAEAKLAEFEDQKALIVKRFDRKFSADGKTISRLHTEDLCQALGVASIQKYEIDRGPGIIPIAQFLKGNENPQQDVENFFRTQILFWLLCAPDGHAKNFSIFIKPGGKRVTTPLYDVMSAFPLLGPSMPAQKLKLAMGWRGRKNHYPWEEVRPNHFFNVGKKIGLSAEKVDGILEDLSIRLPQAFEKTSGELPEGFPRQIFESVRNGVFRQLRKISFYL